MYRQGDILLIPVEITKEKGKSHSGKLLIAKGEASGHVHTLHSPMIIEYKEKEDRFVEVFPESKAELIHNVHAPIEIPAGLYQVIIQREYNSPLEAPSAVAD